MSEQMFKEEANGVVISTANAAALSLLPKTYPATARQGVTIREVAGRPAR